MDNSTQRLDKYLANRGVCSRRDVEAFLSDNDITVNGNRVMEPGTRIDPKEDDIRIHGEEIVQPSFVYFLLNKPKGFISTTSDEYDRKNVIHLIPTKERIYPVGRLDKDTTGLIILTNDGELTNLLTHPRYHVDKTYQLEITGKVTHNQLDKLRKGVLLDDGMTSPAEVVVVSETTSTATLEMKIHEGKNRQIRRMSNAVGIELLSLSRIQFGPISKGDLKEGEYRMLNGQEIKMLRNSTTHTSP
jgi:23S rRNA pseudouridine2605 synthase